MQEAAFQAYIKMEKYMYLEEIISQRILYLNANVMTYGEMNGKK